MHCPVLRSLDRGVFLLADDPDLELGLDFGVQADADAVDAERLDRLFQLDHPGLQDDALGLERFDKLLRAEEKRRRIEESITALG